MKAVHAPIVATAALSIAVGLGSLAALISLNTGASIAIGPLALGSTDGYEQRAFDLLSGSPSPAEIARAETLAERALAISPYDNTARLRLVYIDRLRHDVITPRGVALFVQSYELLPTDQNVAAWRIRYALEHWTELSPEARTLVQNEAMIFARAGSVDPPVRRILTSIRNPSGALAAALWLRQLDR